MLLLVYVFLCHLAPVRCVCLSVWQFICLSIFLSLYVAVCLSSGFFLGPFGYVPISIGL